MNKPIYNQVSKPIVFNFDNTRFMEAIKATYAREKAEHDAKKKKKKKPSDN